MSMRKSYTSEFKLKAASMVLYEDQLFPEIFASLDIGPTTLRRWVEQVRKERVTVRATHLPDAIT